MSISAASENPDALFYGRMSDGKTAQSSDVDVRLGAAGVEILHKGADPVVWPYGTLTAAEPLAEHAIDALLSSPDQPGATLFVGEGTFARRLAGRAPHLTVRAERWRHAKPWLYGAAGIAALTALLWTLDISPWRTVAGLLPDKVRAALGAQVIEQMTEGRAQCHTAAGRQALDRLTDRLSAAAGGAHFKVVVSDWGLVNAFAAPGEQIVLTRGLIENAGSADEVAGVLSHEMGHGIERHPETGLVRALGLSAALDLMMGGSSGTIANAGLLLAQLSYTRAAEREADQQALRIMKGAAVSPSGLAVFFRRVVKLEGEGGLGKAISKIEILRTHPVTEDRIVAVERVAPYPVKPSLSDADWRALKGICSGVKNAPPQGGKPASTDPGRDI